MLHPNNSRRAISNSVGVNYVRALDEPNSDIILHNLRILVAANGTTVPAFIRQYRADYGAGININKLSNYRRDPFWSISFMYVRAIEIGLILIYGYKLRCFDLIRYDFSKNPLPGIIPVEFRRLWVENKIDRDSV